MPGLSNRNLCDKDWRCPNRKGFHILLVCKLHSRYRYRRSCQAGHFSFHSNDWRTRCAGVDANLSIPTASTRLHEVGQALLQKHLGPVLFGIRTLHTHLSLIQNASNFSHRAGNSVTGSRDLSVFAASVLNRFHHELEAFFSSLKLSDSAF